jgi:hypothetical protein
MKKLIIPVLMAVASIATSCAQDKEKREEFKEDHYKNEMVNDLGDSAVAATDSTTVVTDSTEVK